jgi:hypothetical protein
MRQEIADRITELMMEYQGKLNASTLLVQETCSEEEFQRYRRAVGRATDYMFIEISRALEGRPSMDLSERTERAERTEQDMSPH